MAWQAYLPPKGERCAVFFCGFRPPALVASAPDPCSFRPSTPVLPLPTPVASAFRRKNLSALAWRGKRAHRMSSPIGRQLGAFTIQSKLGAGGMGEVYRAHDAKLGRDVAI